MTNIFINFIFSLLTDVKDILIMLKHHLIWNLLLVELMMIGKYKLSLFLLAYKIVENKCSQVQALPETLFYDLQ